MSQLYIGNTHLWDCCWGCFSLESYADAGSRVGSDWSTTVVLKPLTKVNQEKKLQDRNEVMWTDMP